MMSGCIEQGLIESKDIQGRLKALEGDIACNIDKIYVLVQKGGNLLLTLLVTQRKSILSVIHAVTNENSSILKIKTNNRLLVFIFMLISLA